MKQRFNLSSELLRGIVAGILLCTAINLIPAVWLGIQTLQPTQLILSVALFTVYCVLALLATTASSKFYRGIFAALVMLAVLRIGTVIYWLNVPIPSELSNPLASPTTWLSLFMAVFAAVLFYLAVSDSISRTRRMHSTLSR
jgi:hypothetical protein